MGCKRKFLTDCRKEEKGLAPGGINLRPFDLLCVSSAQSKVIEAILVD